MKEHLGHSNLPDPLWYTETMRDREGGGDRGNKIYNHKIGEEGYGMKL